MFGVYVTGHWSPLRGIVAFGIMVGISGYYAGANKEAKTPGLRVQTAVVAVVWAIIACCQFLPVLLEPLE